jgi:hypothetical protein
MCCCAEDGKPQMRNQPENYPTGPVIVQVGQQQKNDLNIQNPSQFLLNVNYKNNMHHGDEKRTIS